jgi:glycerol kinase
VPVSGVAGRPAGGAVRAALPRAGLGKNTYGTGSFVLANAGTSVPKAEEGCSATIAWQIGRSTTYAHEAAIFVTGAACSGCATGSGSSPRRRRRGARGSLDSNDGVYFVPALTGLGSPHWDRTRAGRSSGLTRGSGRAHLARAALEAMAYQTVDAVRAMDRTGREPLAELRADGAATVNTWLMQFQADVLGIPVASPRSAETTAFGAALLAGVGADLLTLARCASSATSAPATSRACRATSASAAGRLASRARA